MLEDLYGKSAQKAAKEDDTNPMPGVHLDYPEHEAFGENGEIEYEL